jgi:mannose-1-phosphate guanylyltransferase
MSGTATWRHGEWNSQRPVWRCRAVTERIGLVMAGGTGTRLYPASRADRPKQFQSFGGDRSLLRQAVDRLSFLDRVYVITRPAFADRVAELAPETTVLSEPEPKDTGPALAYATHEIARREDDPVLLCTPSDHVIGEGFETDASAAVEAAERTDGLVTLGVEPTRDATEYGYIVPAEATGDGTSDPTEATGDGTSDPAEATGDGTSDPTKATQHGPSGPDETDGGGTPVPGDAADGPTPVATFHEKPDAETAVALREQGALWNAGIFAWRPAAFLDAARKSPLRGLIESLEASDAAAGFEHVEAVSVDHAVLERAESVFVVPASFPWDDLGSWDALERLFPGENAVLGDALTIDATDNVIASDDTHVSVLGVEDLVVAAYDDRVLVVPKDRAQEVRRIVAALRGRGEY